MKSLKILFIILLSGTMALLSCTPADTPSDPQQGTLSGIYALDDGTGLTRRYISFSKGNFYDFRLKEDRFSVVLAEGYLWPCEVSDFENVYSGDYEISGGSLICGGMPYGTIQTSKNAVYLNEVKYSAFSGMKAEFPFDYLEDHSIVSANCYIISSPGLYKMRTVKGNSSTSVGNVSSAEVLWESFGTSTAPSKGSIISAVDYQNGYVGFKTPSTLRNGNVVIAAKDAEGNILWSWHIWVCQDYDPNSTAQEYDNNAGVMMDRNLGATSATPGDVGALGLLYQWGRKDPFLESSSISSNARAASTLSWPSTVSSTSSNGTIAYAVAHPTTFITRNSSNNDWYYTGSISTDNTRWQSAKTIYDPCPPGWRVPDGGDSGVWSKAVGSSDYFSGYPYDSTNKGMNFSGKFGSSGTIWYPASGSLDRDDGSLDYVGSDGYWWSCTPSGNLAYRLYIGINGYVYPSNSYGYRAYGFSVRCLQE